MLCAHVTSITVLPPALVLPAGSLGIGDTVVLDAHRKAYAKEADRISNVFADAAKGGPVVTDGRRCARDLGGGNVQAGLGDYCLN